MKRTPLPACRSPIRRVSLKRAKQNREYTKKRKAFLAANGACEVAFVLWGKGARTTEIHHKAGRTGTNFLDESTWMAVSRQGHEWIHSHPSEARARGWLK